MTTAEAEKFLEQGEFGKGSMDPKIKAALYFLAHYGKKVVITSISAIEEAIKGRAGTVIMKTDDMQS
jgi:carbamate kinase